MRRSNLKDWIREERIFILITFLNLIPIFIGRFFPTMDGAIHLYNSNLINELLFTNNEILDQYYSLNSILVPNWTGHFILSFFNLFLPAFLAEKALLLFYFIGLPFAFRGLIKVIDQDGVVISYFIFPFSYSFLFLLGFYNFSIALIFMFLSLKYWLKHYDNKISLKNILLLFILTILTYFSHIFVFGILILLIIIHILSNGIIKIIYGQMSFKRVCSISWQKVIFLVLSTIIPLILALIYFYSRPSGNNLVFYSKSELLDWLVKIRPIIAYNSEIEGPYTKTIFYLIAILVILALYNRINATSIQETLSYKNKILTFFKSVMNLNDFWILSSIILLVLYFLLPDSDGAAGFVSTRLGLLFFLILILWLSTQKYPRWLKIFLIVILLICNFNLTIYYTKTISYLNRIAINCNSIEEKINPFSTVLPINYSDHWLVGNFYGYIGIDKPLIMLQNYEASVGYFPVTWNNGVIPNALLGKFNNKEIKCLNWKSNLNNPPLNIDYIFILGNNNKKLDSCNRIIQNMLSLNYELVDNNEDCKLYKKLR